MRRVERGSAQLCWTDAILLKNKAKYCWQLQVCMVTPWLVSRTAVLLLLPGTWTSVIVTTEKAEILWCHFSLIPVQIGHSQSLTEGRSRKRTLSQLESELSAMFQSQLLSCQTSLMIFAIACRSQLQVNGAHLLHFTSDHKIPAATARHGYPFFNFIFHLLDSDRAVTVSKIPL